MNQFMTTASEIEKEHLEAQSAAKNAVAHALEAGRMLLEVKAQMPHGEFGSWCSDNLPFSATTARGYMRLAKNGNTVADLSLRKALASIRPEVEEESKNALEWLWKAWPKGFIASWKLPNNRIFELWEAHEHPGYFHFAEYALVDGGSHVDETKKPISRDGLWIFLDHYKIKKVMPRFDSQRLCDSVQNGPSNFSK